LYGLELGSFVLHSQIAAGANGEVWTGRHVSSRTPVAIKVLKAELSLKERANRHFRNEVRSMASLAHPHIATIYDHGQIPLELEFASGGDLASGCPYLVMEWASGGTLVDHPMPTTWLRLQDLLLTLLGALGHAHAHGVIHRDLKPANVLFCGEDDLRPGLKLADFGLAIHMDPEQETRRLLGTPHYMAPEQWRSRVREQGPWTDLYALGCLTYRILTGKGPYQAATIKQMRRAHLHDTPPPLHTPFPVPEGFQGWLDRLLSKRPQERYQRAADAALALLDLERPGAAAAPTLYPADAAPLLPDAGLGLYGLRTIPLVDRRAQTHTLWALLERCRTQGLQVALLEGVQGAGKSRLAEWLSVSADEAGSAVTLRASHGPTDDPGDGLGPMVARATRALGLEEDGEKLRERLHAWLDAQGSRDGYELEALMAIVGRGRARSIARVTFNQPAERHGVLGRFLSRVAATRPALVWLDDVQWGLDAVQFVRSVLEHPELSRLPVLFVCTVQLEALAERPVTRNALAELVRRHPKRTARIEVGPLPEDDRRELVRSLLGLTPGLSEQVAELSGGNPLYAVQLVAEFVHSDHLQAGDAGFGLRPGAEVPPDLAGVWRRRVDSLLNLRPLDDRRALEIAALLGQEVDPDEWRATYERAWAIPSVQLVDALLGARLARTGETGPEGGWSFVHPMLRQVLIDQAKAAGRHVVHCRVCAEALRGRDARPERIARLLAQADQRNGALASLLRAWTAALDREDLQEARVLATEHDEVLAGMGLQDEDWRRVDGLLAHARTELLAGNPTAAGAAGQAEVLSRRLGLPRRLARSLGVRARLALVAQDLGAAHELLQQAVPLESKCKARARARLAALRGEVALRRGAVDAGVKSLEVARLAFAEAGQVAWIGRTWQLQGELCLLRGDMRGAHGALNEAVRRLEGAGALRLAAQVHAALGDLEATIGRPEQAAAHYRRALAQLRITAHATDGLRARLEALPVGPAE
jgi:tetratricopeptide (TPR) repeat protein